MKQVRLEMMLPPVGHGYGVTSYALQNLNVLTCNFDQIRFLYLRNIS